MPVTPTYPGVYIEEVPSGVHPITDVATSIAAFIDFFPMGPLDTAVQVLSQEDFDRSFGGLNRDSEASYAIQQFFLNGGTEAFVVPVGDGSAIRSAAVVLLKSRWARRRLWSGILLPNHVSIWNACSIASDSLDTVRHTAGRLQS